MNNERRKEIENDLTPAEAGGLVERLRERAESYRMGGPSSEHTATLLGEAASTLAAERAAHAETKRELARAQEFERQHDYCCCGSRMDNHSIGSGHSPVSQYEYDFTQAIDRAEAAEARLAEALKALGPFKEIAGEPWADENGWTDAACQNDRICDWFGPSTFLAARAALTSKITGGE